MDWLDRMKTGRFKVFHDLTVFWEEFHLYHRRDGKIYKEDDHVLDACRYALMMPRFSRTKAGHSSFNRELVYPDEKAADVSGDDLTYVTYQTARPRPSEGFPGAIEEGQFCVEGNEVILYDMQGQRLGKQEIFRDLRPKQTAAIMLKRRAGTRNSDFNRRLVYPRTYY